MPRPRSENALGTLRSFVTLLVIAHHAVLAYHPFAPPPPASLAAPPQLWRIFPVVDADRWNGFLWFVGFNDSFFMSLLFFISGLFVWDSLGRKGPATYLRDRALRLGGPFLLGALVLAPLAYYPSYLQSGGSGFAGFWKQWLAAGEWPSGPAWFLWLLLAFDCVAVGIFKVLPRFGLTVERPFRLFVGLAVVSALVYVPMALVFNPMRWSGAGPFVFQTSRLLHYLVYFLAGVGLGSGHRLLAPDGPLARRWPAWLVGAAAAFAAVTFAVIGAMTKGGAWNLAAAFGFVLSCAASSFAFLALFLRAFARRPSFLRDQAYGMYVVHYPIVSWLQLALVGVALSGLTKGVLVTAGAVVLSYFFARCSRGT